MKKEVDVNEGVGGKVKAVFESARAKPGRTIGILIVFVVAVVLLSQL